MRYYAYLVLDTILYIIYYLVVTLLILVLFITLYVVINIIYLSLCFYKLFLYVNILDLKTTNEAVYIPKIQKLHIFFTTSTATTVYLKYSADIYKYTVIVIILWYVYMVICGGCFTFQKAYNHAL